MRLGKSHPAPGQSAFYTPQGFVLSPLLFFFYTNDCTVLNSSYGDLQEKSFLRKYNLPQELLIQFYTAVKESVLCTYVTVWFGSATNQDWNNGESGFSHKIIGADVPIIQGLYTSKVRKQAGKSVQLPPL